jgi:hypothetical protein
MTLDDIIATETVKKMKGTKMNWKQVIVYGDRHTQLVDEECDSIMKAYIRDNKASITHVVDVGDGLDNPFMSIFPVDPKINNSAQEEFDLYAAHWRSIERLVPRAKYVVLKGNHDATRLDNAKRINRGLASLRNLEYESVLKESLTELGCDVRKYDIGKIEHILKLTRSNEVLFTHGDPRLNPKIKGGVTGPRRTSEMYPFNGDIITGHTHHHIVYPRPYAGKVLMSLGMMASIDEMKKAYMNHHPYENGFAVIKYNKKLNSRFIQYIPIMRGRAIIDGKLYDARVR